MAITKADVTIYGPQEGGGTPCVIVRKGTDPHPTCVNPQCPKADNCRKHITNRTAEGTPSIAIITWYRCSHYDPIDPEKAASEREQDDACISHAEHEQARLKIKYKEKEE